MDAKFLDCGPNLFFDVDPVAFCRDAMHCVSTRFI